MCQYPFLAHYQKIIKNESERKRCADAEIVSVHRLVMSFSMEISVNFQWIDFG